jgi:hypothetical protein
MTLLTECPQCQGWGVVFKTREGKLTDCPACDPKGALPIVREDVDVLVDNIRDVLEPMLRRNPNIADALADAHPHLVNLIIEQRWV